MYLDNFLIVDVKLYGYSPLPRSFPRTQCIIFDDKSNEQAKYVDITVVEVMVDRKCGTDSEPHKFLTS